MDSRKRANDSWLTGSSMDHTHGRIVVDDAKTEAGVREIHMSPFVREEIALYKASLPHEPDAAAPVFPGRGGRAGDRHNLGRRLTHVVAIANELRLGQSLAPLPRRITPHTFRRTLTFITLSFQAGKDLVFVQSQAGHANWTTTLEIYTRQSSRSIDPEIRRLLDEFLGEPSQPADTETSLDKHLHTRRDIPR